jgi:DNA polymerase-1
MKVAILDGNNMAFAIYSQFKESRGGLLKTSMGIPTTVIFGLLRTLDALVRKTEFDRIAICWDVTGSYYRRKIYPLYKKHRKYTDMKDYFEELDSARKYLEIFGVNQCIAKGIEADDVMGYLAWSLKEKGHRIVIISNDKDFYQVLKKESIRIYRPIMNQFKTERDIIEESGVKPKQLIRIKALMGEDSDFIPGCLDVDKENMKLIKCGFGEAAAKKVLAGKKNLADAIDTCEIERWKDRLKAKRENIMMSYKLARVRTKEDMYEDWEKELLRGLVDKAVQQNQIKVKKIIRIKNDLEIKLVDVPMVLRRLGIGVVGSANSCIGGEIKT